jgi:predicted MFS family arabinose efflux permease
LIAMGGSIAGFALSRSLFLSCLLIFVSGVAMMASASLLLSLVQLIVPDQMRGRVMSVYNLAFRLGIPLGSLGLGNVIPLIGISTALAGTGLALVVIAGFFGIAMRDVAIFRRSIRQAA